MNPPKENFFNWRPYFWIVLAGLVVYFRAIFFGFSYLDDNVLILDNFSFISDLGNIFQSFRVEVFHILHSSIVYYRPILTISFMIDAAIGGASAAIYHFSNILYHLAASCAIFLLLAKLNYRRLVAFAGAVIFAIHPVLSQAVAWIPGRNDSLLAIFALASFIFFIKLFESTESAGWKYLFGHLLFFALALFTKESALVLFPLLIFYQFLIPKEQIQAPQKKINLILAGCWLILIATWWAFRCFALTTSSLSAGVFEIIKAVFFESPAAIQYLGKIFFPFNLSVLPLIEDTTFWYGAAAIVLVVGLMILRRKKINWLAAVFGLAWFAMFLFPSFIRPGGTITADFIEHRLYAPMLGFMIFWLEISGMKNMDFENKKQVLSLAAVGLVFFVITFIHIGVFSNRISFWENAVENSPHSPLAHRNLGAMYYLDGNLEKSEIQYNESLNLNPEEPEVHNNLGLIYAARGQIKQAEQFYLTELSLNPNYSNALFNLGLLYYHNNRKAEAAELWKKTLEINPDHRGASDALGVFYGENN